MICVRILVRTGGEVPAQDSSERYECQSGGVGKDGRNCQGAFDSGACDRDL